MQAPPIIVVGSGVSLLNYTYAGAIDSFPCIVRFNGFQIAPEKIQTLHSGQKVTHIGVNTSKEVVRCYLRGVTPLVPKVSYLIGSRTWSHDRRKQMSRFFRRRKVPFFTMVSENYAPGRSLTCGYLAVLKMLKFYPQICIHGFDSLDPTIATNNKQHYYQKRSDGFRRHNLAWEADEIRKLMLDEKVVSLRSLIEQGVLDDAGAYLSGERPVFAEADLGSDDRQFSQGSEV